MKLEIKIQHLGGILNHVCAYDVLVRTNVVIYSRRWQVEQDLLRILVQVSGLSGDRHLASEVCVNINPCQYPGSRCLLQWPHGSRFCARSDIVSKSYLLTFNEKSRGHEYSVLVWIPSRLGYIGGKSTQLSVNTVKGSMRPR